MPSPRALVRVRSASGIDGGMFQAFAPLPPRGVPSPLGADRDQAVWPGPGQGMDMQPDQSVSRGLTADFGFSQNVSPFDHEPSRATTTWAPS